MWPWHVPPSVLVGLLALAAGHWRLTSGTSGQRRRRLWFLSGLGVLFFALTGPVHELSDHYLFSGHMVQHLLLTVLAPPLLILGTTAAAVRDALKIRRVQAVAGVLVRPVVAGGLFTAALLVWHLPGPYELTMRHHGLHIVEHLSFMTTAVIAWWPVLSPLPEHRLHPGLQMIYLFLLGLPMKLVGALITFSGSVLVPFYAAAPRVTSLTPLADQQLGGLIMWVPGGFTFWVAIAVVFFRWHGREGGVVPSPRAVES